MNTTAGKTLVVHKMETNGNDFLLFEAGTISLSDEHIQKLAHRRLGLGCDQVLQIQHTSTQTVDCTFHNQDGSHADMCLNGTYALAQHLHLQKNAPWQIKTKHSTIRSQMSEQGLLIHIPKSLCSPPKTIDLGNHTSAHWVKTGNEHLIITTTLDIGNFALHEQIINLQKTGLFPNGINVSVTSFPKRNACVMKTHERGVGLTQACGSAGLAVFSLHKQPVNIPMTIHQPGGVVVFTETEDSITMTATCNHIASATVSLQ